MPTGRKAQKLDDDGCYPCTYCGNRKPVEEFRPYVGKGGEFCLRSNYCRICRNARSIRYTQKNKEAIRAKRKSTYDSVLNKERRLLKDFGLTPEAYAALLTRQEHVCAICGQPETALHNDGRVRALAIDHDHTSGVVRGLLCANCNNGLGRFGDSPALLEKAAEYLRNVAVAMEESRRRMILEASDGAEALAW